MRSASIPESWYMVAPSGRVERGGALREALLGTELTLTRRADGRVDARDAAGRARAVAEVNGMVLVWEGAGDPTWEVAPFAEYGDPAWTDLRWARSRTYAAPVQTVQRDVVDNDHFAPVHHLDGPETRARFEGHHVHTVSQGIMNLARIGGPPLRCHIRLAGTLHGVGLLTYRTTITIGLQIHGLLVTAPTPVDSARVRFYVGAMTGRWRIPGVAALVRRGVVASVLDDTERDAAYWESPAGRYLSPTPDPEWPERRAAFERWLAQFAPAAAAAATATA